MRILILGGTGSMGVHLTSLLNKEGYNIYVTSRSKREDYEHVKYIQGNARESLFLNGLLEKGWDVIVDFMNYGTEEFKSRVNRLLDSTNQYVFISSARVYSQSETPITEETPRLLDVSTDKDYLKTDEYGLSKARQENLLRDSGCQNWTVIRPSITFNEERLQLGVLEKEAWLYRVLKGRSIVFSEDITDKVTTMTYGLDVAKGIAAIIGKREALSQAFHITTNEHFKWNHVLNIYLDVLENKLGLRPKVVMVKKSPNLKFGKYQVIYSRYFNRRFDNSKISMFTDVSSFHSVESVLRDCLEAFLESSNFQDINWRLEAANDRVSGEFTSLNEIRGVKFKMLYLLERFNLSVLLTFAKIVRRLFTFKPSKYRN